MSIIEIETPSGIQKVEIAGEEPNQEELQAIQRTFFSDVSSTSPSLEPEIDLATASREELREYARQRRALGVSPTTGQPLTEEEFINEYKEPGVDYDTGVDDVQGFSRIQFGRMDTAEEKANYLQERVGEDGFRTDALGRFIITEQGRQRLGMGEGKPIAVDEEGLSFGDLKEFAGQSGVPILTGIGASLMASGVGFFPGLAIAGLGAGVGKILDEAFETAEGYQRQSLADVGRDAAMEAAFAGVGEGIGRGLSKIFGRVIKGPRGPENEVLRQQAREMIDRGLRPTVAGATNEQFRPILNRLQAVYEGIFPNQTAAKQNLDILLGELRTIAGVSPRAVDDLGETIQKDVLSFYGTEDDLLAQAQRNMDEAIENEIADILNGLKVNEDLPETLVDSIMIRKRVFDEDMDRLFTRATDILKGSNNIVPTKGIKEALEEIAATSAADIGSSRPAAQIRALSEYATPLEINRLRKGLTEASYNPELVGGASQGALGQLKDEVSRAMVQAELGLARGISILRSGGDATKVGASITPASQQAADLMLSVDQLRKGLALLRESNALYGESIKRFDNVVVQNIIKQSNKGQFNSEFIFDKIIQGNNPEALDQLFKAVRGVPNLITDIGESQRFIKSQRIGTQTVEEALADVQNLPVGDPTRQMVQREAARLQQRAQEIASSRGTGAQAAEELRQKLGRMYLRRALDLSRVTDKLTSQSIIDPVKLAANLREKGTTVDKLFGKDKARLDEIIEVLETGKANIAPEVAQGLGARSLAESLEAMKQAQTKRVLLNRNQLLQRMETGDVDLIADTLLKQPNAVRVAERALAPETFEGVRDAAMGRIINQIGGVVDDAGQIQLSGNFFDDFASGRLGGKLQSVLKSYGEEHIDNLFGKQTYRALTGLADDMTRASNQAIAGKGGLAAPQIALGLGLFSIITNPLATLPPAVGYAAMSKMLRNRKVLNLMMRSRSKLTVKQMLRGERVSGDPLGQALQAVLAISSQAGTQAIRGTGEQTAEEAGPYTQGIMQQAQRQLPDLSQMQIAPGSALEGIDVFALQQPAPSQPRNQVSPILVPDPATRAAFGIQ